jgi:hypothetical protein
MADATAATVTATATATAATATAATAAGTVGQLAERVRAKNAGPFWMTLDIFLKSEVDYQHLLATQVLTPDTISALYRVEPDRVLIFEIPRMLAVKISFPRPVVAGSFEDRDLHAGQHHLPLANLSLPVCL